MTVQISGTAGITYPDGVIQATAFGKRFTSTAQAIVAAGGLTIAHGLGKTPSFVRVRIVNVTAEGGYTAGQSIEVTGQFDGVNSRGLSLWADATNLNGRFGSAANSFSLLNATTGVAFNITNANWNVVLDAWG